MQSNCKNRGVFKDSHFVTLLVFAHHPITRGLQKTFKIGLGEAPKALQKALRI